jgi:hypothetical protein
MRAIRIVLQAISVVVVCAAVFSAVAGVRLMAADKPADKAADPAAQKALPAHRVVAYYFHRTQRCPTCKLVGSYVEECLTKGMAAESKDGRVVIQMIDFQDPKNKQYTDYYKIAGPALVICDVKNDKVAAWKPAPKAWSLVGNKDKLFQYVQGEVRAYLEAK